MLTKNYSMQQSKEELEEWYAKPDPWGYETNPDDLKRKEVILDQLKGKRFKRALDIGMGEGWITRELPADAIFGLETSDRAKSRLPSNVTPIDAPEGKYDLIIATGVLYLQYDFELMTKYILEHASGTVLTCNIKGWEVNRLPREKLVKEMEFPYRIYTQHLCVYDFAS